ncbi:MAG TPA: transcriptional repressor [Puia sp.]|nr:transcriptional repressor [Puia sp.]
MKVVNNKNVAPGKPGPYSIIFLKQHHLAVTKARIKILELFQNSENALENQLIEKKTQHQFDRITVYRTLQAFLKKGIIHAIPAYNNSVRYALCKADCDEHAHHDNHLHFICEKCGKTTCLDRTDISIIQLPKGYFLYKADTILTGVCNICMTEK